jgi:hypothetical protein
LTTEGKLLNQEFARARIIIENVFALFRHFKALAERVRRAFGHWDVVFRAALAVVTPRILARVATAQVALPQPRGRDNLP